MEAPKISLTDKLFSWIRGTVDIYDAKSRIELKPLYELIEETITNGESEIRTVYINNNEKFVFKIILTKEKAHKPVTVKVNSEVDWDKIQEELQNKANEAYKPLNDEYDSK